MDIRRPEGLGEPEWQAITAAESRLQLARREEDHSFVLGSAKELVETVAKIVLAAKGRTIRNNASLGEILTEAHRALERQPGEGVAADLEIRTIAQSAKQIAAALGPLRNRYGTGHGRAELPEILEEHAIIGVDAVALWCRWALQRLEHLLAGHPSTLAVDLRSGALFTSGVLRRRLAAANLREQTEDDQHLLGVAVAQRAGRGTFLVREEGVDPPVHDPSLEAWPGAYRSGLVEGVFLNQAGYVDALPELVAAGGRIVARLPNASQVLERVLEQAGQADWAYRFAERDRRTAVVEAMRDVASKIPTEARRAWLALAESFNTGDDG